MKQISSAMTPEELRKFSERHQRFAEIYYNEKSRILTIFLKNRNQKIVDWISFQLSEELTLHPLQAVDALITAFALESY